MYQRGLVPLDVPVPPMLADAVGYDGQARYISMYWEMAGDEVYWDDGRMGSTGHWDGYLAYVQYPSVSRALRPYHLGGSDAEAQHALVLDRETLSLYVGSREDVQSSLEDQWPNPPAMAGEVTAESMPVVLDVLESETWTEVTRRVDPAEIRHQMQAHQRIVAQLRAWLDAQLSPPSHFELG